MDDAIRMARRVAEFVGMFKINIQLFTAAGPEAVSKLAALGAPIFLDLKYHDIPNTVAGAVTAAAKLPGVGLLNIHATGGLRMMEAGAHALAKAAPRGRRPQLIAVTVLTSMDKNAMRQVGLGGAPATRAVALARLAKQAGLDGVVASPHEVRQIRQACGPKFVIVVPGVRPASGESNRDDQVRVATPGEAVQNGADYLVVGRPITAAADPRAAAQAIVQEIASAMRSR